MCWWGDDDDVDINDDDNDDDDDDGDDGDVVGSRYVLNFHSEIYIFNVVCRTYILAIWISQ